MSRPAITARAPRGDAAVDIGDDPEILRSFLEDAAHFPGGHAAAIASPASEAAIAHLLRVADTVLPIGAQSSLTGGATPMGETLLSTARLKRIGPSTDGSIRVGAGVALADLDAVLAREGKSYPPVPTFMGAFIGGTVATNAAGAATFKYGTTRDWVRALTVVLPTGDVLDLERGRTCADASGGFDIRLADRSVRVQVPRYRLPRVPKVSAGFFAAPAMDLIDLFIGAEGTLGIITEITLKLVPVRPATCLAFVPFEDRGAALSFVGFLRQQALQTWRDHDPRGLDVCAIEHMDARCLELLREDGIDHTYGVRVPGGAVMALLITIELPPGITSAQAYDEIGRFGDTGAPDTPLTRFCRALAAAGAVDDVAIAVPGDDARAAQLLALREAVPAAVNARVGRAKIALDARIAKTAGDVIVPFDRIGELMNRYDAEFAQRGLDAAVWGHISDGNLHPNVIPRSWAEAEAGRAAIREFGREAIRMGGSPLAEHGVGRNPIKQQLLVDLYGADGIDEMRAIKRVLDPDYKLAPGVIFERDR